MFNPLQFYEFGKSRGTGPIAGITNNLTAYYKFEGNSLDSIGTNNGTDINISYSDVGLVRKSAVTNSSGSNIVVNKLFTQFPCSFACVFKKNAVINAGNITVQNQNNYTGISIVFGGTSLFFRYGNGLGSGVSSRKDFTPTTTLSTNNLNKNILVVRFIDFNTIELMYNGVSFLTQASAGTATAIDFEVGYKIADSSTSNYFDEFAIWNNRALTNADMTAITNKYNEGNSLI